MTSHSRRFLGEKFGSLQRQGLVGYAPGILFVFIFIMTFYVKHVARAKYTPCLSSPFSKYNEAILVTFQEKVCH